MRMDEISPIYVIIIIELVDSISRDERDSVMHFDLCDFIKNCNKK